MSVRWDAPPPRPLPRARDGSFEPKSAKERPKRPTGADERVISPSAKGLTAGEVQAHLAEVHDVDVSRRAIPTVTDRRGGPRSDPCSGRYSVDAAGMDPAGAVLDLRHLGADVQG
ncbi:transposase [Streptomyces sp. TRM76323]|uniref:Transposase n=1 Tax=Streptomyces tamarix TaxID=3078565 RepID=A0ABU3QE89_9ACTN|nr:transposase [Streptomyces tamarix]MDT9681077.1 transposase [Streptomyces tamarix]